MVTKANDLQKGKEYTTLNGQYLGEFVEFRVKEGCKQAYFMPYAWQPDPIIAKLGISKNIKPGPPMEFIEIPKTLLVQPAYDRGVADKEVLLELGEESILPYEWNTSEYYSYLAGYNSI